MGEFSNINKDTKINKNNIDLYYKFMEDKQINKNKKIINSWFNSIGNSRLVSLASYLNLTLEELTKFVTNDYDNGIGFDRNILKSYIFGVRDILEPSSEYAKEIKQSLSYQNYLQERGLIAQ